MGLIIVNVKVYLTELKNLKVLKSSTPSPDNLFESQKKDFFFFLKYLMSPRRFTPTAQSLIWQHPQDNSHISSLESTDPGTLSEFAVQWKGTKRAENRSLWWTTDYDGEVSKHSSHCLPTYAVWQDLLSYTEANWCLLPKTSHKWDVILLDLWLKTTEKSLFSFQIQHKKTT